METNTYFSHECFGEDRQRDLCPFVLPVAPGAFVSERLVFSSLSRFLSNVPFYHVRVTFQTVQDVVVFSLRVEC